MMVFALGSLKMTLAFLVFVLSVSVSYSQNQEESVFFINRGKNLEWISHSTNDDALHHIISKEVFRHLEIRKGKIDGLQSKSDWLTYRDNLKEKFNASLSKFEKTP